MTEKELLQEIFDKNEKIIENLQSQIDSLYESIVVLNLKWSAIVRQLYEKRCINTQKAAKEINDALKNREFDKFMTRLMTTVKEGK